MSKIAKILNKCKSNSGIYGKGNTSQLNRVQEFNIGLTLETQVIHHISCINKVKLINSRDSEKAFDKIQYNFMITMDSYPEI